MEQLQHDAHDLRWEWAKFEFSKDDDQNDSDQQFYNKHLNHTAFYMGTRNYCACKEIVFAILATVWWLCYVNV